MAKELTFTVFTELFTVASCPGYVAGVGTKPRLIYVTITDLVLTVVVII